MVVGGGGGGTSANAITSVVATNDDDNDNDDGDNDSKDGNALHTVLVEWSMTLAISSRSHYMSCVCAWLVLVCHEVDPMCVSVCVCVCV